MFSYYHQQLKKQLAARANMKLVVSGEDKEEKNL